jgi:hypothetical protein
MDDLRLRGVPVCAELLALQLIHLKLAYPAVELPNLWRRIFHHLYKSNITHIAITHKAQNIRYFDHTIQDWVAYINRQILTGQYLGCLIIYANETNVDFDPMPRNALDQIGTRSVRLRCNGSSGHCTVILEVKSTGVKMPLFIIFKGSPTGRISCEFNDQDY